MNHIVNLPDSLGNTLLHLAVMQVDKNFKDNDREAAIMIVRYLAQKKVGGRYTKVNSQGKSVLDYAKSIRDAEAQKQVLVILKSAYK